MLMHLQNYLWNRGNKYRNKILKEVIKVLNKGKNVHQIDIDTKLSEMKLIPVKWLISLYHKLRNSGEMIKLAFENASIMEAIDNKEILDEDPFKYLSE